SLTVLEESKLILWVTSTDYSSISNSLQGLETLRNLSYPEEKVRLVLNATSSEDGVRPEKLEQALGQSFFWKVPYDKQLRLAGQMGKPAVLMPVNTRGAQSISQLARSLVGVSSNGRPRLPLLGRLRERRQPSVPVAPLEGRS
ncbi:MAG TPA: hypothetical protein VNL15_01155, partial [Dehalococcoidia bacterium]|nr:hypothetical protein [Dehalococcoidia bacterium]